MTADETEIVITLIDSACERLSADELTELAQCVSQTRFSRLRSMYSARLDIATTPRERFKAGVWMRQWQRENTVARQVFDASDRISEALNLLMANDIDEPLTTDHDNVIARTILVEVLDEVDRLTGIADALDPISLACCASAIKSFDLPVNDLAIQLAEIQREKNQRALYAVIIDAVGADPDADPLTIFESVAANLRHCELPLPETAHLTASIDNVKSQLSMVGQLRQRV